MRMMRILGIFLIAVSVGASGLDSETRTLLIKKFDKVHKSLDSRDSAFVGVTLRLADLQADRARVEAQEELESGCTQCQAGLQDRRSAIRLYDSVQGRLEGEHQARVRFQIGHLSELIGDFSKAERIYQESIAQNNYLGLRAEAQVALGELYFKQLHYKKAREAFAQARQGALKDKGLASYRMAWSSFNLGEYRSAAEELKNILGTTTLLSRSGTEPDPQFQAEVARDLATFLGRSRPEEKDFQDLARLSPASDRVINLQSLAGELDRLGDKSRSIAAHVYALKIETQPRQRLEGQIRLAQLYHETAQTELGLKMFLEAVQEWPKAGCESECQELKSRMKKYVLDWHKSIKGQFERGLLTAYEGYLQLFPFEPEMVLWSGLIAKDLRDLKLARVRLNDFLKLPVANVTEQQVEAGLVALLEVAELAQDPAEQKAAMEVYLARSTLKTKAVEVRYQLAYWHYKNNQPLAAVALMNAFVREEQSAPKELREQAADLSLDVLAAEKRDSEIESLSAEWASLFPKKKLEYVAILRKSQMNRVATLSGENLEMAWAKIEQVPLEGASEDEKALYWKNRMILAEKTARYLEARKSAQNFLAIKTLSAADQELGWTKLGWYSELLMDFKQAFEAQKKSKSTELTQDQKMLRAAMLAELANQNAAPLYLEFVNKAQDREGARLVAARLVRDSKNPATELTKWKKVLAEDQALMGQLVLEVWSKQGYEVARKFRGDLKTSAVGRDLDRHALLAEIEAKSPASHQIATKNQRELNRTLKQRIQLLRDFEKVVGKAVTQADWVSQVVGLAQLKGESERFYQDLMGLPLPEDLTPDEESQYLAAMGETAAPYQKKAQEIQGKLDEFLSGGHYEKLLEDFESSSPAAQTVYVEQLRKVLPHLSAERKTSAEGRLVVKAVEQNPPTDAEVQAALSAVQQSPLDRERLLKLSEVERRRGQETLAAYLEARANQTPAGGAQ